MKYETLLLSLLSIADISSCLIASNKLNVTGNVSFICAMFRPKNLIFDDLLMPEILTFCTCSVVSPKWALTANKCFVQTDWYVSVLTQPFTEKLPDIYHKIENLAYGRELIMMKVTPNFNATPVQIATKPIDKSQRCLLYGLSTPNDEPVSGNAEHFIYNVWNMRGDVYSVQVHALQYLECRKRYSNYLSDYKREIVNSTLCLDNLNDEYVEPCSFDRGAPVVCDGKLQAVLIYDRPLPDNFPRYLPTGCYGNINQSLSIYAESINDEYYDWINKVLELGD